ncbi:unnamed protein product [Caenorhabditis brenneri]
MKHWRFFPILVKEEVLKNMDVSDRLSFSKCSKKSRNLLSRIPNHLECFRIPDDSRFSNDDFLVLMTCRKSTIQNLIVEIELSDERYQVMQFLLKLNEVRNSLKVKKLIMELSPEYSEMFKKCIDFCDPSFIESIEIEGLDSQEVYEDILKTPHWKNSREVLLNGDYLLEMNLNDFLHFKSISLNVEELSVDDAWKLVQNFLTNESENDSLDIRTEVPIKIDLIRHKIETELVGDWKGMTHNYIRFAVHPKNPQLILRCMYEWYRFNVEFIAPERFDFYRPWFLN